MEPLNNDQLFVDGILCDGAIVGRLEAGPTVKIESFPCTRYGHLTGKVMSVSHDAAQDEDLGLVFPARIRLEHSTLNIDDGVVSMSAGMTLSAEIKTGKRRVIDYLLSPFRQHVGEGDARAVG